MVCLLLWYDYPESCSIHNRLSMLVVSRASSAIALPTSNAVKRWLDRMKSGALTVLWRGNLFSNNKRITF